MIIPLGAGATMGAGGGVGAGGGKAAGLLPATEVCAALLMLCWLCCWPDDSNSGNHSQSVSKKQQNKFRHYASFLD